MSAPETTALLKAAPADGEEVIVAAASPVAEAEIADEISLTMEEAVATGISVLDTPVDVVELLASRAIFRRVLPLRLSSAGATV